jgi:phosphatidylserine/phosphatidylglycerophosphate/cardiolipin synthase-like enzyme
MSYDRIAGYFQSSVLELANEELAAIPRVRIVCNTEVNPDDLRTVRMAAGGRRKELENELLRVIWNSGHFTHQVDVHGELAQNRFRVLHDLLVASGQDGRMFEIRVVPDSEFGFVHGKGGVIEGTAGATSFIGSANDSANAWMKNYELVWEDAPSALDRVLIAAIRENINRTGLPPTVRCRRTCQDREGPPRGSAWA